MAKRLTTLCEEINQLPNMDARLVDSTWRPEPRKVGRLIVGQGKTQKGKRLIVNECFPGGYTKVFEFNGADPYKRNRDVERFVAEIAEPCTRCGERGTAKRRTFSTNKLVCVLEDRCALRRHEAKYDRFSDIPQFTEFYGYEVDCGWTFLQKWIDDAKEGTTSFEMNPDFQRGHVWTREQQIAYVEFCLRGGTSARHIYWNCPSYDGRSKDRSMVLVDGLQRVTAVLAFINNELPAFQTLYKDYKDELRMLTGPCRFRMCVNNLKNRADILTWYLEMNTGGTVHTKSEIDRVRRLLDEELELQEG